MANQTATSTAPQRQRQRPPALMLTCMPPGSHSLSESETNDEPRPPPTPSLLHPSSLSDAMHLLHLRITHLGAGFLSEIVSSTHPSQQLQLQHHFADGMRDYVSTFEDCAAGTLYEDLGLRMLRDAVLRGRTPRCAWLDVSPSVEGVKRRAVVGELETWAHERKKSIWTWHWEMRRAWAVQQVEEEVEGKRVDAMRKGFLLDGLGDEELGWRMRSWEFYLEVEREGVRSLEEEFRGVGEWPVGCRPGDEYEDGDDEEKVEGEQQERSEAIEDGWVVLIPKHECECMWHQT